MPTYLDYHSTTPMLPEVWEAMQPYATQQFGNPASAHGAGRSARRALEQAREQIASLLDCFPDELLFTSGATESNNLAIHGLAGESPGHVLASAMEHPCVLEPIKQLSTTGFKVDWLPNTRTGSVDLSQWQSALRPETTLATLMLVNHETGAIQPVSQLTEQLLNHSHVFVHTDAAQAVGKLPVSFRQLNVATLAFSGHKFGGPKGIGGLILRRCTVLKPLFQGGHQQRGKRPGTEPVWLVVGMAKALELALQQQAAKYAQVQQLRHFFIQQLQERAAPIAINSSEDGSPYVVNISFLGCRAEALLMRLDLSGIYCSTGSACSSGSNLPSAVLQSMGVPDSELTSAMRFSFSATQSCEQLQEAIDKIVLAVARIRQERDPGPLNMLHSMSHP